MVKICCVSGCKSESYLGCGISFHWFPKDEVLKNKWTNIIPLKHALKKYSSVCSIHFKSEDFTHTGSRSVLKSDAVPSIFPAACAALTPHLKLTDPPVDPPLHTVVFGKTMSEEYVAYPNDSPSNAPSEDPLKVTVEDVKPVLACRCCLITEHPLRPLDHSLIEAYGLIASPVDESRMYSKFVCLYCCGLLQKFMMFRKKCLFNQNALINIASMGIPITVELLKSCFPISTYPLRVTDTLVIHLQDVPSTQHEPSTQHVDESAASSSVAQNLLQTETHNIQNDEKIKVEIIPDTLDDETFNFIDENNEEDDASSVSEETDLPDCLRDFNSDIYKKDTKQNFKEYSGKIKQVKTEKQTIDSAANFGIVKHVDMSIGDSILFRDSIESTSAQTSSAITKVEKPAKIMSKKKVSTKKVQKAQRKTVNLKGLKAWIEELKSKRQDAETSEMINSKINIKLKAKLKERAEFEKTFDVKIVSLSKDQQIQQINERKNTDKYKNAKYKCELCYRGFSFKVTYENHMAQHKPAKGRVMCEICKKYFLKSDMTQHMAAFHTDDYDCSQCDHVSKSRNVKKPIRKRRSGPRIKGRHSEDQMKKALDSVKAGMSIRRAAVSSGLAYATLGRYAKIQANSTVPVRLTPNYSVRKIFTVEQEQALNDCFINCALMFHGLTRNSYRSLAYEMAILENVKVPPTWNENHMAGIDWMRGFREKFPKATVHKRMARATAFNKANVDRFYDDLQNVITHNAAFVDGTRIYNLDETATTTDSENSIVIAPRGQNNICKYASGEEGTLVTTCNIISAGGQALPPVFVFPGVEVSQRMQEGTPPGSLILAASDGCMNSSLFPDVMKHFVQHTGSTKDHPTLLLMDNHESHLSIEALNLAKDAGVTVLTLNLHTSDRLQPLDVGIHGPFATHYASAMESWMKHYPGMPVTIYEVGALVGQALERAMTPANIRSAFEKTGIFPFNRNVFSEDEFLPTSISDQQMREAAERPVEPGVTGSSRTLPRVKIKEAEPSGLQVPPSMNNTEPNVIRRSIDATENPSGLSGKKSNGTKAKRPRKNRVTGPRKKGAFTEDQMKKALDFVKTGMSIRKAGFNSGIAYATLGRYVKLQKAEKLTRFTPHFDSRKIFTLEQEQALNEYFLNYALMFHGLSRNSYRSLAYEMAILENVMVPPTWNENQMAGIDWMRGFRERFPNATVRKRMARATAFNKVNVDRFYDDLLNVLSHNAAFVDGTRIYNLDETATTTDSENPIVIAPRGQNNICTYASGEEGTLVTTCNIISAGGQALPPVFVFPGVEVSPRMQEGTPSGSLILAASDGCMNSSLFPDVMKHFVQHSGSTKDHPTLLLMDNHESHLSIEALNLAKDAGVTVLTLNLHTSDRLQPLDVGIHGPFATHYASAMESWMMHYPGMPVTIYEVGALVGQALERAMTPANIRSAFEKTGIFPFDRNVFSVDDFLPSGEPEVSKPEDAVPPLTKATEQKPNDNKTIN